MERLSRIKEYHMKKMRQSFGAGTGGPKNQQQSNSEPQKGRRQANSIPVERRGNENRSGVGNKAAGGLGFDLNASINQRASFGAGGVSVARLASSGSENDDQGSAGEHPSASAGGLKSSLKRGTAALNTKRSISLPANTTDNS